MREKMREQQRDQGRAKKHFTVANKCVKYLTNSNHLCEPYVSNAYTDRVPDENLNLSIPNTIINVMCASRRFFIASND